MVTYIRVGMGGKFSNDSSGLHVYPGVGAKDLVEFENWGYPHFWNVSLVTRYYIFSTWSWGITRLVIWTTCRDSKIVMFSRGRNLEGDKSYKTFDLKTKCLKFWCNFRLLKLNVQKLDGIFRLLKITGYIITGYCNARWSSKFMRIYNSLEAHI